LQKKTAVIMKIKNEMSRMKKTSTLFHAPLAHTYSIVARDPVTGELGAAVQSHWFAVGPT
jgi:hypothetical protein